MPTNPTPEQPEELRMNEYIIVYDDNETRTVEASSIENALLHPKVYEYIDQIIAVMRTKENIDHASQD